jgi:hypothetical protein
VDSLDIPFGAISQYGLACGEQRYPVKPGRCHDHPVCRIGMEVSRKAPAVNRNGRFYWSELDTWQGQGFLDPLRHIAAQYEALVENVELDDAGGSGSAPPWQSATRR